MTTPRKKWPHACEWARLDCIALARRGRAELVGMIDEVESPVVLRRLAKALDAFREIEQRLVEVKGE